MNKSLEKKLHLIVLRYQEIEHLLSDPNIISDKNKFADLSREYAQIEPLVLKYREYQDILASLAGAEEMLKEEDSELRSMAQEEILDFKQRQESCEQELQVLLLPKDPDDNNDVFVEIRAGAGGDEAAIFSGDLLKMYLLYAQKNNWRADVMSRSEASQGGFKEVILKIEGQAVYSKLKFESGAHRVQRIPVTESQGRIHTSTCTVAVLPESKIVDSVSINPADLKVDTYRASGAGGQHVNKTDSAVRITHLPTGIVVECQDDRSQHKNRARAMSLLQARILDQERSAQLTAQAAQRKSLVGTGDRSERIRTYNYPQSRVTDHRINLTLYKLDEILQGDLDEIIVPLQQEEHAKLLAEFKDYDD